MTPADEGPSWSDIADWYDRLLDGGSPPHLLAVDCLVGLVPALDGLEVLDLACGQGVATRALAAAGARRVVGTDLSPEMIGHARRREDPQSHGTQVEYVEDDAQTLATFADASFDGVTCQLGLMDIPDLQATLAAVHRVLRPGGWFAFVIGHPCFLTPHAGRATGSDGEPAVVVNGYFDERFWRSTNPDGVRRAGNHHRTLSTYLNALVAAGFSIEQMVEPVASEALALRQPVYRQVPIFLAGLVRKRST